MNSLLYLFFQILNLKEELSKKETQLVGLQMKVDSAEHQQAERDAYMAVLKEQTVSKEKQITMLQSDVRITQEFNNRLEALGFHYIYFRANFFHLIAISNESLL